MVRAPRLAGHHTVALVSSLTGGATEQADIIEHEKNRQWKASARYKRAAARDAVCAATRPSCAVCASLWGCLL